MELWDDNLKSVLKSIAYTAATFILLNATIFIYKIISKGIGESWSYNYKHGSFYLNDEPAGFVFGSDQATLFMTSVFFFLIIRYFIKGKIKF